MQILYHTSLANALLHCWWLKSLDCWSHPTCSRQMSTGVCLGLYDRLACDFIINSCLHQRHKGHAITVECGLWLYVGFESCFASQVRIQYAWQIQDSRFWKTGGTEPSGISYYSKIWKMLMEIPANKQVGWTVGGAAQVRIIMIIYIYRI